MTEAKLTVHYLDAGTRMGISADPAEALRAAGYEGKDWRSTDHRITIRHPHSAVIDGIEVGPIHGLELVTIEVFS